jgi:hypothetical protein
MKASIEIALALFAFVAAALWLRSALFPIPKKISIGGAEPTVLQRAKIQTEWLHHSAAKALGALGPPCSLHCMIYLPGNKH